MCIAGIREYTMNNQLQFRLYLLGYGGGFPLGGSGVSLLAYRCVGLGCREIWGSFMKGRKNAVYCSANGLPVE
jgi:hypothetical protein